MFDLGRNAARQVSVDVFAGESRVASPRVLRGYEDFALPVAHGLTSALHEHISSPRMFDLGTAHGDDSVMYCR
jgi:hypothetical protein